MCSVSCPQSFFSLSRERTGSLAPPQAYRRKFVVLVNYSTRGLKAVDVMEDEFSAETAETIEVGEYDRIEVQERQSKSKRKYSFQVRKIAGGGGGTALSGNLSVRVA